MISGNSFLISFSIFSVKLPTHYIIPIASDTYNIKNQVVVNVQLWGDVKQVKSKYDILVLAEQMTRDLSPFPFHHTLLMNQSLLSLRKNKDDKITCPRSTGKSTEKENNASHPTFGIVIVYELARDTRNWASYTYEL